MYSRLWMDSFSEANEMLHPDYIDHARLPAPGHTAALSYKARYLYKDEPAGLESDVVTAVVSEWRCIGVENFSATLKPRAAYSGTRF